MRIETEHSTATKTTPSSHSCGTLKNIGYRFLVEARRLWELEDLDNVKLTTFQATMLLSLAYNSHGMGEWSRPCASPTIHSLLSFFFHTMPFTNNVRLLTLSPSRQDW